MNIFDARKLQKIISNSHSNSKQKFCRTGTKTDGKLYYSCFIKICEIGGWNITRDINIMQDHINMGATIEIYYIDVDSSVKGHNFTKGLWLVEIIEIDNDKECMKYEIQD